MILRAWSDLHIKVMRRHLVDIGGNVAVLRSEEGKLAIEAFFALVPSYNNAFRICDRNDPAIRKRQLKGPHPIERPNTTPDSIGGICTITAFDEQSTIRTTVSIQRSLGYRLVTPLAVPKKLH